jgi:hypothetical protein
MTPTYFQIQFYRGVETGNCSHRKSRRILSPLIDLSQITCVTSSLHISRTSAPCCANKVILYFRTPLFFEFGIKKRTIPSKSSDFFSNSTSLPDPEDFRFTADGLRVGFGITGPTPTPVVGLTYACLRDSRSTHTDSEHRRLGGGVDARGRGFGCVLCSCGTTIVWEGGVLNALSNSSKNRSLSAVVFHDMIELSVTRCRNTTMCPRECLGSAIARADPHFYEISTRFSVY